MARLGLLSRTLAPAPDRGAADATRARLADALVRTGEHDHRAFRELYDLTSAKLFGICLAVCGERPAAEDVLHDVYMAIWHHAGAWVADRGSAIAWMCAIARNRSIDWRRRQAAGPTVSIDHAWDVVDPAPCAEAVLVSKEIERDVRQLLELLDQRQRNAICDAFFHGATYAELAERNAVPLGTMKSWVRRGLARIKEQLDVAD